MNEFKIDPEFKSLIPPLTTEEYNQLESSIKRDGCLSPIVIWQENLLVLDGHNRLEIMSKLDTKTIPVKQVSLSTRKDAEEWIIRNQFGRRNLTAYQRAELALKLEPLIAAKAKLAQVRKPESVCQKSDKQTPIDTKKELASIAGISHDTMAKAKIISTRGSEELQAKVRSGNLSINKAANDIKRADKKIEHEKELKKPVEAKGPFGLILADPPWRYDFSETPERKIENHYPTATTEDICGHKPKDLMDDCILFLWATAPKLLEALEVMKAWGFSYKSQAIWDKQKIGMGYWFRGQHEILLVGVKGKPSTPPEQERVSSIFSEARTAHSVKPESVYHWIEQCYPQIPKLEMYSRKERKNWQKWGNE